MFSVGRKNGDTTRRCREDMSLHILKSIACPPKTSLEKGHSIEKLTACAEQTVVTHFKGHHAGQSGVTIPDIEGLLVRAEGEAVGKGRSLVRRATVLSGATR